MVPEFADASAPQPTALAGCYKAAMLQFKPEKPRYCLTWPLTTRGSAKTGVTLRPPVCYQIELLFTQLSTRGILGMLDPPSMQAQGHAAHTSLSAEQAHMPVT